MPPLVVPVSSCRRANGACDRLQRASANHPNHGATLGATLSCQGDLAAAGCASAGDHAPRARHRRRKHARLGRHLLRGLGGSRGRARHQHACSAETPQPPLSGRGRSLLRRSFLRNRERDPHDIPCEVWLLQSACSRAMASLLPPRACGLPRREKASHRWLPLSVATPGWSPRKARPRGTGWIAFRESGSCALECVFARIRLGVSCLEGGPSLDRLPQHFAAPDSPKHGDYQGKVGATGFEPATFRPPAECATRLRHAPVTGQS